MKLLWSKLYIFTIYLLLVSVVVTADEYDEDDENDSTDIDELSNIKENKESNNNTVSNDIIDDDDDDDDDEDEDYEGDEETMCDYRISSFVRNFNSTPFLPDDYENVYDSVTKTNFIHRKYNITDMMTIVDRAINYVTKLGGNRDLADTGMYISSIIMDRIYEAKVSPECSADLANIGNGLRNYQLWPAKCKFYFFLNLLFALIFINLPFGQFNSFRFNG